MADWLPLSRDPASSGADPRLAGGRLTIDLGALTANYGLLQRQAGGAKVAGVVKADAYGLGADRVGPALWGAGCRTFFVALPEEGIALREVLPEAEIYVLNGLFGPEAAPAYGRYRLMPVLGSRTDIACWEAYGWDGETPRPCAIHVDTGMNRLGLSMEEALSFAADNDLTGAVTPKLLMSHLVCADDPQNPMNRRQLESFQVVRTAFGEIDSSLSNSAGIFLGPDFAFDLVRPGIALYGGAPQSNLANPMQSVAAAHARVVHVRHARAGETVSYGASHSLTRDSVVAIVSVGYADGYHRSGSGSGVSLRQAVTDAAEGAIHGRRVRVCGRITMDLTMFDVTDLGINGVSPGDWIELFGDTISIDEAATAAGTISYELLTSLGRRYHRHYVGASTHDT